MGGRHQQSPSRWRAPLIAVAALLAAACADSASNGPPSAGGDARAGWRVAPEGDLNAFFDCLDAEGLTIVSAHRGGPAPGLPENALETLAATLEAAPAIMEVDVAATADGVLYLMHDRTLERTTTGGGPADEISVGALRALFLEDASGRVTDFAPPLFKDVLQWADGKTIIQIDFKRSARYEDVIAEIRRQRAERRVMLIAYSLASARKLHSLAPEIMISLNIETLSALNAAVAAGVPADRLVGFTGVGDPKPRLLRLLDDRDVETIVATLGGSDSIDVEIAASGDEARYAEIAGMGADIIATDRPRAAFAALDAAGLAPGDGVCGIERQAP